MILKGFLMVGPDSMESLIFVDGNPDNPGSDLYAKPFGTVDARSHMFCTRKRSILWPPCIARHSMRKRCATRSLVKAFSNESTLKFADRAFLGGSLDLKKDEGDRGIDPTSSGMDELLSAYNGRGAWWNSGPSYMDSAFPTHWFTQQGLMNLLSQHQRFQDLS